MVSRSFYKKITTNHALPPLPACLLAFLCVGLGACSLNTLAIRAVSDSLTGEGRTAVFTGDGDPVLVGDALPFAIKMYESLLAANPDHPGLILTTGSLFVMYANAFVQGPAEFLEAGHYEQRLAALERARKLYLRGAEILVRGLENQYPGFVAASSGGAASAAAGGAASQGTLPVYLARMTRADVPLLYWTAVAYLSAYALDPFDLTMGSKVQGLVAWIDRAYELDSGFNQGALDEVYILILSSLPEALGGDKTRVALHFERALEKSRGLLAGPYVAYAQAVLIPAQDYGAFKALLEKALSLDPDADPPNRLVNILAQQKARLLLDTAYNYFLEADLEGEGED